jgi:hypothetical protein
MGLPEDMEGTDPALSDTEHEVDTVPAHASAPRQEEKSGFDNAEQSYDTGLTAWLQVLGSFFLWFNSW